MRCKPTDRDARSWTREGTTVVGAMTAAIATSLVMAIALTPGAAFAEEKAEKDGSWLDNVYLRAGVMHIQTLENSSEVELSNITGPVSLALENGPIDGSSVSVGASTLFAATAGYVLPGFGGKLSIETIVLSIPFPVKFELRAEGTLADESLAPFALDNIPTDVPALGNELGSTTAIPPILTVVYSPMRGKTIQPYVGAGGAYLIPVGCEITNPILTEVVDPDCQVDIIALGNLGFVVQAGVEFSFGRFFINADVKYIEGLSLTAKIENVYVNTPGLPLFESVQVGTTSATVGVDPLIVQLAGGTRF